MIGYILQNQFFYKYLNTSGEVHISQSLGEYLRYGKELAGRYIQSSPFPLKGKVVLEIGVGYSLGACYELVKSAGCKFVYGYDYGDFLNRRLDEEMRKHYGEKVASRVKYIVGLERLKRIELCDYVVSCAVLEHVWNLEELLEVLKEITHEDSVMFHQVDYGNHSKFAKYEELYFLSFSDWLWELMAKKVAHQTRILFREMKDIFEKKGFSVTVLHNEEYSIQMR